MTGGAGKLALEGGTPVRQTPLLPGWPGGLLIGEEEKRQVLEVLESQSLYRHYGPRPRHKTAELEQGFARLMGTRHALAVTSGVPAQRREVAPDEPETAFKARLSSLHGVAFHCTGFQAAQSCARAQTSRRNAGRSPRLLAVPLQSWARRAPCERLAACV